MFDFDNMINDINSIPNRTENALIAYGNTVAADIQGKAQQGRIWTDRTAQARQRIKGYCVKSDKGVRIYLAHGVDYGIYLEFAHEKKYAIIYPTLRREAPKIIQGCVKLIGGIR